MSEFSFTSSYFTSDEYDPTLSASQQGQLSSDYTNTLTSALTNPDGVLADYVAWLYFNSGATLVEALAVKDAVLAGNFSLSGLFGAAQSKIDEVSGSAITDPKPTITVLGASIDLTAMMGSLDTETWSQLNVSKKSTETIFHTREFYTSTQEPVDYDPNWANPGPTIAASSLSRVGGWAIGVRLDLVGRA